MPKPFKSIWTTRAAELRAGLPETPKALPDKIRELLRMPDLPPPEAVATDRGFLLTTDPGVQVPVLRMGTGPQAVIWLGESDFETESRRSEVQALTQHASVFVVEPRGAGMSAEMHILRQAPIVMGRTSRRDVGARLALCGGLPGRAAGNRDRIFVAGSGRETGLACPFGVCIGRTHQGSGD